MKLAFKLFILALPMFISVNLMANDFCVDYGNYRDCVVHTPTDCRACGGLLFIERTFELDPNACINGKGYTSTWYKDESRSVAGGLSCVVQILPDNEKEQKWDTNETQWWRTMKNGYIFSGPAKNVLKPGHNIIPKKTVSILISVEK